jgi:hypothetical protein
MPVSSPMMTDYLAYLEWLGEALAATGCRLHAYY